MNGKRWSDLMRGEGELTPEELKEGWHFCPGWDDLLIGPDDPEWSCCFCEEDIVDGDKQ